MPVESTDFLAFTADHVSRLTGLSDRQLRYWSDTGFFAPRQMPGRARQAFGRIYSFRDLVGLRTIAVLRRNYGIPLQELRRVGARLAELRSEPWSRIKFYVAGRAVHFRHPDTGATVSTRPFGQAVLPLDVEPIAFEMQSAAKALARRTPDQVGKIAHHRYVVHNEPVVEGTRVPTAAIWNLSVAGYDAAAIVAEYPRLNAEDVGAALEFEAARRQKRAG